MYPHPFSWLTAVSALALAGQTPAIIGKSSLAPSGRGCPLTEAIWHAPEKAKAKPSASGSDLRILSFGP